MLRNQKTFVRFEQAGSRYTNYADITTFCAQVYLVPSPETGVHNFPPKHISYEQSSLSERPGAWHNEQNHFIAQTAHVT